MKNIFTIALIALGLASCTQDSIMPMPQAMNMPVNPVVVPVAPTVAVNDDCVFNPEVPLTFEIMLVQVNGNFVAAPLIGTLVVDASNPIPTAFCSHTSSTSATEWLNGQVSGDLLYFDLPFYLSDGTVEYVTSSLSYQPDSQVLAIYTGNTSDGDYFVFSGVLVCD